MTTFLIGSACGAVITIAAAVGYFYWLARDKRNLR
jgi:hypothetical protein